MADKIIRALVVDRPYFGQDAVLYMPGEAAPVNVEALGVDDLDHKSVVGLEKLSTKADEHVAQVPIAAVAPHAPDAPNPQGLPTGTVISGTGRNVQLETSGLGPMRGAPVVPAEATAIEPVGADKPGVDGEQTPQKTAKPKK